MVISLETKRGARSILQGEYDNLMHSANFFHAESLGKIAKKVKANYWKDMRTALKRRLVPKYTKYLQDAGYKSIILSIMLSILIKWALKLAWEWFVNNYVRSPKAFVPTTPGYLG
jgi:hypothetical protein